VIGLRSKTKNKTRWEIEAPCFGFGNMPKSAEGLTAAARRTELDRRQILNGGMGMVGASALMPFLGGTAATATAGESGSGSGSGNFDPTNPAHNAEVLARINLGIGSGTDYGWFKGRVFAVIGDEQVIEPLFDLEGFGANRMVPLGDSRYQSLHREVGYYKDLRTGKIMEQWANPMLDGEVVEVSSISSDPVNHVVGPIIEAKLGEDQYSEQHPLDLQWTFMGDLAMTSMDVNTRWKNPLDPAVWPRASSGDEYVRVSEYLQFYAQRSDLENWRSLERIPSNGNWQRIATWLPWMLMGDRPGHLFYRCYTKNLASVDEIPADIRAYTEKNYPTFMEAPETWTEPNVTSYARYILENESKLPKQ
jgi:hypothetical protein